MNRMRASLFLAAIVLALHASPARAHFVWILSELKGSELALQSGFGEPGEWDEELAGKIKEARYFVRTADGKRKELKFQPVADKGIYAASIPADGAGEILGECVYGVTKFGAVTAPVLLTYHAKHLPGQPAAWPKSPAAEPLAVEVFPQFDGRTIDLLVLAHGKPYPNADVKVTGPKSNRKVVKTDAAGKAKWPYEGAGPYALFVGHRRPAKGEHDGKPYDDVREYATLSFTLGGDKAAASAAHGEPAAETADSSHAGKELPLLPEAVTAFGAAVDDGWLYVYSGHTGKTHQHSAQNLFNGFRRTRLEGGGDWETLPMQTPLQSNALIPYQGKIYRIGGMVAVNKPGEAEDMRSVTEFARFDPKIRQWEALPPLPEPRSSHDAIVIDDVLYVVGGWNLQGGGEEFWQSTYLTLDLKKSPLKWETKPQPFERRALAIAQHDGKLYVLGGFDSNNKPSKKVDVLDPSTGKWATAPELPGIAMNGFACSGYDVGGDLAMCAVDGEVHVMPKGKSEWRRVGRLTIPRFQHRVLPTGPRSFIAVGGASMALDHLRSIERFHLDADANRPRVLAWTIPFSGEARQGYSAALQGDSLYIVGGNKDANPHAFSPENFLKQAYRLQVGSLQLGPIQDLPSAGQSMELATIGKRGAGEIAALGGVGGGRGEFLASVQRFTPKKNSWANAPAGLPTPMAMFRTAVHKDVVWLFGGGTPSEPSEGQAFHVSNQVRTWNPADGKVAEAGVQLPRSRRAFGGAAAGEKFYLVGGMTADFQFVVECDVLDLGSKKWSTISSPSQPRVFTELAATKDALWLAGGFSPDAGKRFAPNQSIERFDLKIQKWSTLMTKSPVPAENLRLAAFQERLLLCGLDPRKPGQLHVAIIAP